MKSYSGVFNALAGASEELVSTAENHLEADAFEANPDIVDAMHETIGLTKSEPHISANKEHEEAQAVFRDQAAASSGDPSLLAGRIASGAAASAISDNQSVSNEEKKKKEKARFLETLLAMRADLDRRIGELETQYHDLMEEAQEHFDTANELDDLANKIEDGTASAEDIERARKLLGKDKDTPLDRKNWTAELRENRDIQNRFGLDKAEEAQKIRERAESLRQEREELDEDIERIQALPVEERPAAAEQVVEKMAEKGKSIDLDSDKLSKTPEIRKTAEASTDSVMDDSVAVDAGDGLEEEVTIAPPTLG